LSAQNRNQRQRPHHRIQGGNRLDRKCGAKHVAALASFQDAECARNPARIALDAGSFAYSWSRFSAIFTAFIIEYLINTSGVTGVFLFTSAGIAIVIPTIG
jgi:hypothetical protein